MKIASISSLLLLSASVGFANGDECASVDAAGIPHTSYEIGDGFICTELIAMLDAQFTGVAAEIAAGFSLMGNYAETGNLMTYTLSITKTDMSTYTCQETTGNVVTATDEATGTSSFTTSIDTMANPADVDTISGAVSDAVSDATETEQVFENLCNGITVTISNPSGSADDQFAFSASGTVPIGNFNVAYACSDVLFTAGCSIAATPEAAPMAAPEATPEATPVSAPVEAPTTPSNPTPSPISCFSEVATMQLEGKSEPVAMKDLQVGDKVYTGSSTGFQPVYAFGHKNPDAVAAFVQIQMDNGKSLEATQGHLVFANGQGLPVPMGSIKVGDILQGEGAAVTNVNIVTRTGVYTPFTMSGKIVIDGVMTSNYVVMEKLQNLFLFGQNVHGISHLAISPFRLLCTEVSSKVCESYNDEGIPSMLDQLRQASEWFAGLPMILQAIAVSLYLVIAALSWTMECVLLITPAPVVSVLAAGIGFMVMNKKNKSVCN